MALHDKNFVNRSINGQRTGLSNEDKAKLRNVTNKNAWAIDRVLEVVAQAGGPNMMAPVQPVAPGQPQDPNISNQPNDMKMQVDQMRSQGMDDMAIMQNLVNGGSIGQDMAGNPELLDMIKQSGDGNQPEGTAANPIDGQRDSLSSEEIEGTGKLGRVAQDKYRKFLDDLRQQEQFEKDPKSQPFQKTDPSLESIERALPPKMREMPDPRKMKLQPYKPPESGEKGDPFRKAPFMTKQVLPQPTIPFPDSTFEPEEVKDEERKKTKKEIYKEKALEKKKQKEEANPFNKMPVEEKQKIVISFLGYLQSLEHKFNTLSEMLSDANNPVPFSSSNYSPADKKLIMKEFERMQGRVSKAGSLYTKLVKLLGPSVFESTKEVDWLKRMMTNPKQVMRSPDTSGQTEMKETEFDKPEGPTTGPDTPNVKRIDNPQFKKKTNIQAQVPPPPGPPPVPGQQAPGPDAPQMNNPEEVFNDEDVGPEDPRSLDELLVDLEQDFEALKEKVESGETMINGEPAEPVVEDSGAMPGGPPKIAVDEEAKDYYEDYFGEYGEQLTRDRCAEIVDAVDSQIEAITASQANNLVSLLSLADHNNINWPEDFAAVCDKLYIDHVVRTGLYNKDYTPTRTLAKSLGQVIYASLPAEIKAKHDEYVKLADKMKVPKVNTKHEDWVDVEDMEDEAEKGDIQLARPAHLPITIDDQVIEGKYMKLTLSWDPDHPAADRSAAGIEHAIISFVKGLESEKEFKDLGYLGQIQLEELDIEGGFAIAYFRTGKGSDAPPLIKTTPEKKD